MAPTATIAYGHGGAEAFYHGDSPSSPTPTVTAGAGEIYLNIASPTAVDHSDFTPIHYNSLPMLVPFRQIEVPSFYLTGLIVGSESYTSLHATPIPCDIPSGTTLYLTFGPLLQSVTTSGITLAGATTVVVETFTAHFTFTPISYLLGDLVTTGAIVTIGLNRELGAGEIILLNSGTVTQPVVVDKFVPQSANSIHTLPFSTPYDYDSQATEVTFTADSAQDSNVLTNVSSVDGLKIGQQVQNDALALVYPAMISAIDGDAMTVTLTRGFPNAAPAGATFTVQATELLAPFPMTLGAGTTQETVYPISLPVQDGENFTLNIAGITEFAHKSGEQFSYYQWPQHLKPGDVTYRPDYSKFFMWDGETWRTARVNSVQGQYAVLGAIGGNDFTSITIKDPATGLETPPDTFTNTSSKGYEVHYGGHRATDPSKAEWTGETLANVQMHLRVRIPQSSSVAFRSLALAAFYKAAPEPKDIHLSPSDQLEIVPGVTNYVNWTFSDLDNEPQSGWEVRIFDDLTYNMDSFDPDTSSALWKSVGHDAANAAQVDGKAGFVNGETYWAFVRVAKQFQQTRWWGDWRSARFSAVIPQPLPPIVSIWGDTENAANVINIQATDNMLGPNNGGFERGLGGWTINTSGDNSHMAVIDPLVTGIALSATLQTKTAITSLPVGATGYIARGSAIAGTGKGTFKVSGSRKKNTDPLGFPRSGKFWIRIGTENILVQNMLDGNNNGDTFKILERNHSVDTAPATIQTAHAAGAAIEFGLQSAVHTGSIIDMEFSYTQTVHHTKKVTSLVRYYTGTYGYPGSAGTSLSTVSGMLITGQIDAQDTLLVKDTVGGFTNASKGKAASVTFHHWDKSAQHNLTIVTDKHGHQNAVAAASGSGIGKSENNTIRGYEVLTTYMAPGLPTQTTLGTVASTRFGTRSQPITSIPILPAQQDGASFLATLGNNKQGGVDTTGSEFGIPSQSVATNNNVWNAETYSTGSSMMSKSYLPAGTRLSLSITPGAYINELSTVTNPIHPSTGAQGAQGIISITPTRRGAYHWVPEPGVNAVSINVTLARDYHWGQTTLYVQPISSGKNLARTGDAVEILAGSIVTFQDRPKATSRLIKVHLDQAVGHTSFFKGQHAAWGDTLNLQHVMTTAGSPGAAGTPGVYLTKPVTTTQVVTEHVAHDVKQHATVSFNPSYPYEEIMGTIGNWDSGSSTWTPYTPSSTDATFNAVAFTTNPGSVTGLPISGLGIPNAAVVDTQATSGGNYIVTFKNPATGTAVLGNTPFTNLSGAVQTIPVCNISVDIEPAGRSVIPAGSRSIPIKPFKSKIAFPTYTPINIRYHTPAYFGENSLVVHAKEASKNISVHLVPSANKAGWTETNSVKVVAGHTYGLAAFSKLVKGTGSPLFSLFIDWYTETGVLLGTSNGQPPAISNPHNGITGLGGTGGGILGTGNSLVPDSEPAGVVLNSTDNSYGSHWTPNAIVGVAPSGATRAVPRIEWIHDATHPIALSDIYALSSVMYKALQVKNAGPSNYVTTTVMPNLTHAVDSSNSGTGTSLVLPRSTPLTGSNALYHLDPYNQYGTRELNLGDSKNTLWTFMVGSVLAGSSTLILNRIGGLGVGSEIVVDFGTDSEETVIVGEIDANTTITLASPFTMDHKSRSKVYSRTVGLAHQVLNDHAAGEPVAVFNWNRDGYLNTPNASFYFKVEKSEDLGKTWNNIRNGAKVPVGASGAVTITDYEVIPNHRTMYRVTPIFTTTVAGSPHTSHGAITGAIEAPPLDTTTWWISSTSDATKRFPINVKDAPTETQKHPMGVFYPLGSARPITVSGVVQGRDGNITVIWTDLANWQNFLDLLKLGEVYVLTNPVESTRMYIAINEDVQITHHAAASPWREVNIQYVEAAPPGYGFTYGN